MQRKRTKQDMERTLLETYLGNVSEGDELGEMRARRMAQRLAEPMHRLLQSAQRAQQFRRN